MGDDLLFIDLGSGRNAKTISAGDVHTFVLFDDDQVKCFGDNT